MKTKCSNCGVESKNQLDEGKILNILQKNYPFDGEMVTCACIGPETCGVVSCRIVQEHIAKAIATGDVYQPKD